MPSLIVLGVFALLALGLVCFAAYKIKARTFEVAAAIGKFASLSITILSAVEHIELSKSEPELK